ncbi:asparagine synthase-related protein [Streptomyces sp. NPDC050423]|uniref:asparagine synthase-related protein n=1 Tax=Streptomyces sp. NPDC050423 TaxID=3155402 RepID=UPI0034367917
MRTRATIGSDLSGGLDSTPMGFLASRATEAADGKLVTVRIGVADPTHDDHIRAARAQELLNGGHVTHTVFRPGELPDMFERIAQPVTGFDEPTRWIRPVARLQDTARRLGEAGAVVHLTGHGGDEVLPVKPNYLHDLMRRRPALAREHLAGMRALRRRPLGGTMRALAEHRPYGPWPARQADDPGSPFPAGNLPLFGSPSLLQGLRPVTYGGGPGRATYGRRRNTRWP